MPITIFELMDSNLEEKFKKEVENKFLCPNKFAQEIERLVQENDDMNYIDSIIHYCEENKIDVETVPKLLSKPLKEKIKYEAMELNFIKKTSKARLVF